MDWTRILAYITGSVDQELLLRNEYLAAENRILRAQLNGCLRLSDAERATLGEIGFRLGHKALRVCPGSLSRITKLSQHESDRRESEEGQRIAAEVLKIFGQATATVEPGDSPFNYPAFRKNDKPFGLI